jgi:hypothetical protein
VEGMKDRWGREGEEDVRWSRRVGEGLAGSFRRACQTTREHLNANLMRSNTKARSASLTVTPAAVATMALCGTTAQNKSRDHAARGATPPRARESRGRAFLGSGGPQPSGCNECSLPRSTQAQRRRRSQTRKVLREQVGSLVRRASESSHFELRTLAEMCGNFVKTIYNRASMCKAFFRARGHFLSAVLSRKSGVFRDFSHVICANGTTTLSRKR